MPTYIAVIADVETADSREIVVWWSREQGLPTWSRELKKILLVQPTAAAAERVFSLLSSCFTDPRHHALEDYLETTVILRYNRHGDAENK